MIQLLRETNAYKKMLSDAEQGALPHATLVVFPDEKLLRALLKECAKAFFSAEEGSRTARLIGEEHFSDCLIFPEAGGKLTAELGGRIIDESILRPVEEDKKLFVLDAFHTVTPLVQNKLLKVIEEPPAGAYFLLGATSEHPVLPTILSRVIKISVPPFAEERVAAALGREHRGAAGIEEAAAASGGLYSVGESLLLDGGKEFRLAEEFLLTDEPEKFCRGLSEKEDKRAFFSALMQVLRDAMMIANGQVGFAKRRGESTQRIAKTYPAGAIARAVELTQGAEREIGFNANFPQCALALAVRIGKEKEVWKRLS